MKKDKRNIIIIILTTIIVIFACIIGYISYLLSDYTVRVNLYPKVAKTAVSEVNTYTVDIPFNNH